MSGASQHIVRRSTRLAARRIAAEWARRGYTVDTVVVDASNSAVQQVTRGELPAPAGSNNRGRDESNAASREEGIVNARQAAPRISNPREAFVDPQHLVDAKGMSDDEKIKLLLDWRQDLIEMQTASEENMPGQRDDAGVALRLKAVTDALIALGHESD